MWSWWLICFKDPLAGDGTLPSCHCLSIHRSKHIAVALYRVTWGIDPRRWTKLLLEELHPQIAMLNQIDGLPQRCTKPIRACCGCMLFLLAVSAELGNLWGTIEPDTKSNNTILRSSSFTSGKEWNCISRKESQLSSKWEPPKKLIYVIMVGS